MAGRDIPSSSSSWAGFLTAQETEGQSQEQNLMDAISLEIRETLNSHSSIRFLFLCISHQFINIFYVLFCMVAENCHWKFLQHFFLFFSFI